MGTEAFSYLQELVVIQPTQHQLMAQFHHLCWNTRIQLPQTPTQTGKDTTHPCRVPSASLVRVLLL